MSNAEITVSQRSQYVDFWNDVLVPKFVRWRHILVGGLTLHSEKVFPSRRCERATQSLMPVAALAIPQFSLRA